MKRRDFLKIPPALAATTLVQPPSETTSVLAAPTTTGKNDHYPGNRPPLMPRPLIKLPTGSIRPAGWLRHQMELMAAGFTGHLPEISAFCKFEGNAWTDSHGVGKGGWEEVPYWLRGYVALGYALHNDRIIAESRRWLDAVLASQWPNGYFGSPDNLTTRQGPTRLSGPDLWPNMLMLYPLRTFYEATGDPRVLPFMSKYFQWQMTIPLEQFLPGSWQKVRGGDNLDSIHWLYNQTGESWLLDLARITHERTTDWVSDVANWHGVNFAQGFREPAQYYQQTQDERYLHATERDFDTMHQVYGQVPGGLYGSDEACRPGFTGPRQAAETCAMAEMMYSDELLLGITGNPLWADRAEDIAFNSLPASMTSDLKGLHYLTSPNIVQLDRVPKWPCIGDPGDRFSYNPYMYRCCQHNVAFAWPYYAEHLWMAAQSNGLAAVFYASSVVEAQVGHGVRVRIQEETDYPFGETVEFTVNSPEPVLFSLQLRVPGWCEGSSVAVNGQTLAVKASPGGYMHVRRMWKDGDQVTLNLPMKITATLWAKNRNTVSVSRGPITYSLQIGEQWKRYGDSDQWPAHEVFAATPWNYGLVIDPGAPASGVQLVKQQPPPDQPFAPDQAPTVLRARGRRIPQWKLESNGMIGEVQPGPVRSNEPVEEITLIPMGCARLRISAFPVIGEGPEAHVWKESVPIVLASSASYKDSPNPIRDGTEPGSSADTSVPGFFWAGARSTSEWVEYRFGGPQQFASAEVYWAEGTTPFGPSRLPANWQILWWDGAGWQAVESSAGSETVKDRFSQVRFKPVTTTALRLKTELRDGACAGILAWRVDK
jgi:hypothetical protein